MPMHLCDSTVVVVFRCVSCESHISGYNSKRQSHARTRTTSVSISTHTPKKGEANSERHNRQNQTIAILVVAFDLSCCLFVCVDVSSKSKAMQTERFYKMTSYFPFKSDFVHRCNAHCSVQRDKSFVFCTLCMWHSMFMFRV